MEWGSIRGKCGPLTFGTEVQTFHVEGAAPQGNLLKDDPKAVHITRLGTPGRGRGHSQELRGCPQLFWGSEVRSHRVKGPKAKG